MLISKAFVFILHLLHLPLKRSLPLSSRLAQLKIDMSPWGFSIGERNVAFMVFPHNDDV